jgi:DNA-binding MarR family transcriptional regulator
MLSDDDARLWHAWKTATERVEARVAADIAAATGLSVADFAILTRLSELGGGALRQNELAVALGWHRSRLSHQLSRMERKGLLERVPHDSGVEVRLSDRGAGQVALARPVHAAAVRAHLIDPIPATEAARLRVVLEVLGADGAAGGA